jgi:aerobic carbon-monoxide dehydrogenase medium subunit
MKPVAFDIVRPRTTKEVIRCLAEPTAGARVVAGSQSLGPMLNLRLVQPRILCDITGIEELTSFTEENDALVVGASVTTGSIEDRRLPLDGFAMLPDVAAGIAYRAVRNRGTIGGSICHADPAADWPSALCGLNASCIIAGPVSSRRTLPISDFITGAFENGLNQGELLVGIRIPRQSRGAKWGYKKLCRKTGEFASAIAVVNIDLDRGMFRLVFGATEGRHLVIADFRSLCDEGQPAPSSTAVRKLLTEAGLSTTHISQQIAMMQRAFFQAGVRCEN